MTEHTCLAFRPRFCRLKVLVLCLAPVLVYGTALLSVHAQENPMAAPTYPVDDEPEGATPEASAQGADKAEPGKAETPAATAGATAVPTARYSVVVAPLPPQRPFVMVPGAPASGPALATPAPAVSVAPAVSGPVSSTAPPSARIEIAKDEPSQSGEKPAPEVAGPKAAAEPMTPVPSLTSAPSVTAPPPVEPSGIETEPNMRIASLTITTQPATTEEIEAEEEKTPEPMIVEKQTDAVNIACLQPEVFKLIRQAGEYFGGTPIITSGQRDRGRRGSYHRKCMAADFFVPGIERARLAKYLRTLPAAGGVGTYCHTKSVHIDTGEPRNWWQCGLRFRFAQR